ncbi:MAG: polymer-forming cytoskeletal protein [Flexistipes sinusarabici]|uniref:Polymer-forming cytoskeletal protein n=1 Tax=Flexistipes sinusarabici TaxID=2352 RepID=A0A5D0MYQ1_FLESI|nr:polymer-forming cytoskeletal protein [Flexistipes sinusarabici]TYB37314.1 MAG: polymer-forming cytoskeletal protein [Flexistipes sinusarabici]
MMKTKNEDGTINAFLGKNTSFNGTLAFDGLVRIDGTFEGNVKTEDTFVIANSGRVKADIDAGTVKISGNYEGTVVAKTKVELYKPAQVTGTIKTPSLLIEDGVVFNGTTEMGKNNGKNTKPNEGEKK